MWQIVKPLLPVRDLRKGGAPRKYDDRLVLDSIFYVLRSGCQWRMLPRDLMPYDAAHRWFTTWRKDGTWDRIHDALRRQVRVEAGRDPEPSAAALDARSIKCSGGGEQRGYDAGKRTTGRNYCCRPTSERSACGATRATSRASPGTPAPTGAGGSARTAP
jgi:transposase